MNNKKQETTQKPVSTNELIEATKATSLKKGEAIISVIKKNNDDVHLKWSGTNQDLLNSAFTLLQNDLHIAAIICRAAKDYIETCKAEPEKWMRLTQEIAGFQGTPVSTMDSGKEEAS